MRHIATSRRARRAAPLALGVVAACTLALVPAPIVIAGVEVPSFSLSGHASVSGAPKAYRADFYAGEDSIDFWLSRKAPSGNHPTQQHEWNIDSTQLTCGQNLGACHVIDLGSLGSIGAMDLDFTPTAPAKVHQNFCDDGTTVTSTLTRRKGVLRGTLRVVTGTDFFGTIRNRGTQVRVPASFPVTAQKLVRSGLDCPPGPDQPCPSFTGFGMATATKFVIGQKFGTDPKAGLQATWHPDTGEPNVRLNHSIYGGVPRSAVRVTSNEPKPLNRGRVDFDTLAPFVTGDGTFYGIDEPEVNAGTCPSVNRGGTFDVDLEAHFDGWGLVHFGGGPGNGVHAPYP